MWVCWCFSTGAISVQQSGLYSRVNLWTAVAFGGFPPHFIGLLRDLFSWRNYISTFAWKCLGSQQNVRERENHSFFDPVARMNLNVLFSFLLSVKKIYFLLRVFANFVQIRAVNQLANGHHHHASNCWKIYNYTDPDIRSYFSAAFVSNAWTKDPHQKTNSSLCLCLRVCGPSSACNPLVLPRRAASSQVSELNQLSCWNSLAQWA